MSSWFDTTSTSSFSNSSSFTSSNRELSIRVQSGIHNHGSSDDDSSSGSEGEDDLFSISSGNQATCSSINDMVTGHRVFRRERRSTSWTTHSSICENTNIMNEYIFLARCIAFPVSEILFNPNLARPNPAPVTEVTLEEITTKCVWHLKKNFPVPNHEECNEPLKKFLTGVFVRPCPATPDYDGRQRRCSGSDGIDLVDSVVLWLFCHTTKGGPAHTKLLAGRPSQLYGLPGMNSKSSPILYTWTADHDGYNAQQLSGLSTLSELDVYALSGQCSDHSSRAPRIGQAAML
eukprot:sb/3467662/